VLRSPLLIAPVAGLAVGLSGLKVPAPFESFTTLLGGAASPAALICIGLFLAQERVVSDDIKSIGILVTLKLILQPAVTAFLAFYVFSMPTLSSHSAVILSALPIGSEPFTIAKLYGLEAGVTSGSILASHVFAVLTVSLSSPVCANLIQTPTPMESHHESLPIAPPTFIARLLKRRGVTRVFAPGGAIMPIWMRLDAEGIRIIDAVRDERAAVHMAAGTCRTHRRTRRGAGQPAPE
jgi:hypothetical protein